jgi:hypothetical protein
VVKEFFGKARFKEYSHGYVMDERLEKTSKRWLGHNLLLEQEIRDPINLTLLKLIYEAYTIKRVRPAPEGL